MSERARFKKAIPLVSVHYYNDIKGEPLATAYYRGDVLKYAGDNISPEQVAQENVRTVKVQQYIRNHIAKEGGSIIAEGIEENIKVDTPTIRREYALSPQDYGRGKMQLDHGKTEEPTGPEKEFMAKVVQMENRQVPNRFKINTQGRQNG
ncbi:MAG: hypothetical protein IJ218_01230 [Alphaproteobacteria bacterium]|nr:hypothetical protein [Alphaproteobacteria bacterium]